MDEVQGERLAPIKRRKIMGVTLAPWRSPLSQGMQVWRAYYLECVRANDEAGYIVILVGFVCFLCPGMFLDSYQAMSQSNG
jgi:hypothetical protein